MCALEWLLAEGCDGELKGLPPDELLSRLQRANPSDGVRIVGALSAYRDSNVVANAVRAQPHWLVRLAGYATGICSVDPTGPAFTDNNHWINELVGLRDVLDLWPTKATATDIARLDSAPKEAFVGEYGAPRRVLRLLLMHRAAPHLSAGDATSCA